VQNPACPLLYNFTISGNTLRNKEARNSWAGSENIGCEFCHLDKGEASFGRGLDWSRVLLLFELDNGSSLFSSGGVVA
jgi:hypothetical protein